MILYLIRKLLVSQHPDIGRNLHPVTGVQGRMYVVSCDGKNVWGLSASDSTRVRKYYEANRDKYWWEKSAEVLIFTSNNKELIETIHEVIGKGLEKWNAIAQKYENQLQVDSGRYEITQLPGNPGYVTAKKSIEITQLDELYFFAT